MQPMMMTRRCDPSSRLRLDFGLACLFIEGIIEAPPPFQPDFPEDTMPAQEKACSSGEKSRTTRQADSPCVINIHHAHMPSSAPRSGPAAPPRSSSLRSCDACASSCAFRCDSWREAAARHPELYSTPRPKKKQNRLRFHARPLWSTRGRAGGRSTTSSALLRLLLLNVPLSDVRQHVDSS